MSRSFARATLGFQSPRPKDREYRKSAEWFLDNHYLVTRAVRQIATEIPPGFRRRLPYVSDGSVPRVLLVAHAIAAATHLELDETTIVTFVEAYQAVASLTIAELWALPAMLRIAALQPLARALDSFFAPATVATTANATATATAQRPAWEVLASTSVVVERGVRVLRLLAEIDWRTFVQRTSAVEAVLRRDPLGVYVAMDFDSRDTYRKEVESLAWATDRPEPEVARLAVELAAEGLAAARGDDRREGHVGYYLVDKGRIRLEGRVGYRPRGLDRLRAALLRHPALAYLGSVAATSVLPLAVGFALATPRVRPAARVLGTVLAAVPVVSLSVAFTNRWVGRMLSPRPLPKLDLEGGVPAELRTAVVMPALVASRDDFDRLLAQLELHHLSCPDPSLAFVLLSDHVDAPERHDDAELLAHAESVVRALNLKYARPDSGSGPVAGPFHVLHREARWNDRESRFMGWERKRGKLEELNRLLRGDLTTSFKHHIGDPAGLRGVRFVITLDADTQLPMGAARKLIGFAAHPLHTARIDPASGRVDAGYTVAQPRVDASPVDGSTTQFSRLWCGDTALDIYTRAVSDVYQDLFGSGSYVGKGIYEIDSFMASVDGRVPENTLASHDLFEGIHGRAALVSDVVVFEQYPQNYLSAARRMHRWIRGDWQLAPWLLPRVPSSAGHRLPNQLTLIDRWKILDNLRRSLLAPSLVSLVYLGWACLPSSAAAVALAPLLVPLLASAPALFDGHLGPTLSRCALGVAFLPHEAWTAIDAIVRVVVRMGFTKRHLLQWVTADATARALASGSRALFWRDMGLPAVAAVALGAFAVLGNPAALPYAIPVLSLWLASPEIARWISAPDAPKAELSPSDRVTLRRLARRTWLFFETFVGPGDQWLPPDNFQEPGSIIAHRTSPTNIGLMLVADLAAYDFGYIGRAELAALVGQSMDTIARLERYRGHWLNWYDTRTLEPLLPRYVSTVDSGNLAASLITVANGCREAALAPAVRPVRFEGLADTLDLLAESLAGLAIPHAAASKEIDRIRDSIALGRRSAAAAAAASTALAAQVPDLETALLEVLEQTTTLPEVASLREVQVWLARFRHQLRSLHSDMDAIEPDTVLRDQLLALATRIDAERARPDFTFLFDPARKLFYIGYNATSDRLDDNHYDLLASEARLASFLAVVQSEVPPEHWLTLGRPVTRIQGKAALLSWGGTMFEYLMPTLLMRTQDRTLLQQSAELAVAAQIEHGKKSCIPWGVSESGYSQQDAQGNYHYRSFGVPGLGLRRGLEDDRVVAPYACVLALPYRPREVLDNLEALRIIGAHGLYGLYEAVDYDEDRTRRPAPGTSGDSRALALVRSHMAHHQGMILGALDNALHGDALVARFHADPLVQLGAALLSERLPSVRVAEALAPASKEAAAAGAGETLSLPSWVPASTRAQAALLGNGRLTTVVTDSGAGFTSWNDLAITRAGLDPTRDVDGTWIYLRDEKSGHTWSAAPAPTRPRLPTDEVVFHAHQVDFHHRDEGISLRTHIAVAASDDIEVRHVTLHNETPEHRTLMLMTFAEPVLEAAAGSGRQPAFSRLFVECEHLSALHGVVATRRARSPDDPQVVMVQSLVWDDPCVSWVGSETDRRSFIGRRRDARTAECRIGGDDAAMSVHAPLDPAIGLALRVELAPGARIEVALVTAVAGTRDAALGLARRFASLHAVRWTAHDARIEVARRLAREGMTASLFVPAMQLASRILLLAGTGRVARAPLSAAQPSKSDLWGHGLSGDYPLIVVRLQSPVFATLAAEVLATYRHLRACRIKVEVVFLDGASTGYQSEGPDSVRALLIQAGAGIWLSQRAGIFVLATDQLPEPDHMRLLQVALVVLDSEKGTLAEQLPPVAAPPPPMPHFVATAAPHIGPHPRPALPTLVFETEHGGFTEDGREYVVKADATRPTPAPWCNVLANAEAGCLVSESSLGVTWAGNSGENRLTPWRNDAVTDAPSEALYLRDEETAQVWSPTPLPAGLDVDTVVRHGAGYTVFERESHGLRQRLTVFVPPDAPVKIVRLTLDNHLDRPRRVTATYYAEWVLGAHREEQRSHVVCEIDVASQCLLARCGWNIDFAERVAFLCSDCDVHGFTCDRAELLGRSGSYEYPEGLGRWGLSQSQEGGADPCAVLQTHLEIAAGASLTTHFVLGQGSDRAAALELVRRFRSPAEVESAWLALHEHWDAVLGAVQVKTPEPAMDLLLNRWLLYQSLSSRLLARTAFYQSSGAFGFRDQLQDVMALVHGAPALARAHILEAAAHQFEEGDVLHWWHPPASRGVRTRCSDDLVWLPFVTAHYVETTGDVGILEEAVPFLTASLLGSDEHDRYAHFAVSTTVGSLFEHCRRALARSATEGAHGLPLMGDSDWNDGMSRVGHLGRGESVWLGFFLAATMNRFADLCDRHLPSSGDGDTWRERARAMGASIDRGSWDGRWYLRAFYDDGTPLGGDGSAACSIDSIPQSWAVLAGVADPDRALTALRSADERLVDDGARLVRVLAPPFDDSSRDPGYIRAYPPGVRENGGQYTHAATWLGFAHVQAGDGDRAARVFRLLNPILHGATALEAERYRVEPYVLAADVYGTSPFIGRGGWTWYTGAAAWMWRLGVEAMLGLRKQDGGLRLEPCIPSHWPGFEATVRQGGEEIHVIVDNASGAGRGVASATLDGSAMGVALVPLGNGTGRREVHIVLGPPTRRDSAGVERGRSER